MEPIAPGSKKLPITRILVLTFVAALAIAGIVGGFYYLDFHAGSLSNTFHPNGMEISVVSRGFSSGTTSVGSMEGEDVPLTFLARVEDFEFKVTATDVVWNEKQIGRIPAGTQKVSIASYGSQTTIEADGKRIAAIGNPQ